MPSSPSARPLVLRSVLCLLLALAAAAGVFHRQWIEGNPFVGNFDRLNGGSLPLRVHELRSIQSGEPVSSWSENVFMGLDLGSHGAYRLGASPISWLAARFGADHFLGVMAAVAATLLALAGLAAYATLRRLGFSRLPSATGAVCYACATLFTVRLAQSEGFAYNFVLGPLLFFLLLEPGAGRPLRGLLGLAAVAYLLFSFSFLQETAYLLLAAGAFALIEAWKRRSASTLAVLVTAVLVAGVAAAPRILQVQHELSLLQRQPTGAAAGKVTFESSYAQQHLTAREFWRFLDDGVFGRHPGQAAALGNNINLNEGFQVHSSTLASLLVLLSIGLALSRRRSPAPAGRVRWPVVFAAAACLIVSWLVLTKSGLWLLYQLFLHLDFSHGRLVAAMLFPLSILIAHALDELTPPPGPEPRRRGATLALSAVAALGVVVLLGTVRDRRTVPARLDLAAPLGHQVRTIVALVRNRPLPVPAPTGGMARWLGPGTAGLAWTAMDDATVEVEMQHGAEPFVVMGRNDANRYTVGSLDPHGDYRFRLRAWRDGVSSGYSPVLAVAPLPPGARFEDEAPRLSSDEKTWLVSGEVLYVLAVFVCFVAWTVACRATRNRPRLRYALVSGLAFAIMFEAWSGLEFRLNGPHTRSFPVPFQKDDLFVSEPGTLAPPSAAARRELNTRLERDAYRTVLLEPAAQFYSTTLHVPMAWDLRTPQGGWSGVPRRLAVLPWPDGIVSMRRLIFRPDREIPWELLGALNVKYALTVDTSLYFNTDPTHGSGNRFASLQIAANPLPVTPRQFFAQRTVPLQPLEKRQVFPVPMPADPTRESFVEGLPEARDWPAGGPISANYRGDRITLRFAPMDAARFLVLNELYHPDWQARTPDGRPLRIFPVNTVMRGIEVPPGVSGLELEFRPFPGRLAGYAFPLAGLCGLLGAGFVLRRAGSWSWLPSFAAGGGAIRRLAAAAARVRSINPLVVLAVAYLVMYGSLLLATDGYPYGLDNNESYSCWWHARSLVKNGLAHTKGLTDEVFSPEHAASPYIHSHQGNFPRLFTVGLYAVGIRSIAAEIWITTFTVGLAGLYLAYRFLADLANPRFAVIACLVMMSNYLLFAQWQVNLYNVWHVFFFFSSLRCVQVLRSASRGRWFLLTFLNCAALFYWEYVFTTFVVALCGLYALLSYWRRPRLLLLAAGAVVAGGVAAAGLLLAQLTAYMGWASVLEDVRLTLTARNAAADPALLAAVTRFYHEHRIVFWYNFFEAAPLRNVAAFGKSLVHDHLDYYSGPLALAMCLTLPGWLVALARRSLPALRGTAGGWLAAATYGLVAFFLWRTLGDTFAGGVGPAGPIGESDAARTFLLAAAVLVGLAASLRPARSADDGTCAGLLTLFLGALAAYALTYRIFTGYVFSGYLNRLVPMLVFVTDAMLALAFYLGAQAVAHHGSALVGGLPASGAPDPRTDTASRAGWRWIPALAGLAYCGILAVQWAGVQAEALRLVPPDSYSFLSRLEREPYRGRSVVTNVYPAPIAARTGSWGYADTTIFSGLLALAPSGFQVERDLKYLWFADRDTNPDYLRPDLALAFVPTPNVAEARARAAEWRELQATGAARIPPGLVRRASSRFQPFLQDRLMHTDNRRLDIVDLDWDFPPFLRRNEAQVHEVAAQLTFEQKLALSASASMTNRRWRVEWRRLDGADALPAGALALVCDGREVPVPPVAAGGRVVLADHLQLRVRGTASGGRLHVTVNDAAEDFDLSELAGREAAFEWSSSAPQGRFTRLPAFAPGFFVETRLPGARPVVEAAYRYAQQDGVPEANTAVRLYHEEAAGQWTLVDTVNFLGSRALPVRLDEFRRTNPDTLAAHAAARVQGDRRTYEQWLTDHLAAHPAEWTRPGVVRELLPAAAPAPGNDQVRRMALPVGLPGRYQLSVSPGTRTKSGHEYFGLPFSVTGSSTDRDAVVPIVAPPVAYAPGNLPFGRMRVKLRFPADRGDQAEPVVVTGGNEAGDILYVIYSDPHHIRLGFDHWYAGGPLTAPIAIDYSRPHEIEISMGSLFPPADDVVFVNLAPADVQRVKDRVKVVLDGATVIDSAGTCYESAPDQVTVGRNEIRATSCGPTFSGEILSVTRAWPKELH
ncbi:MAG TPA: fibronectin type III domain-containing protein [Lacunisphaera sp.]|nr:fibronectin type III domain-containing protein [Lacunisphaera sp.]